MYTSTPELTLNSWQDTDYRRHSTYTFTGSSLIINDAAWGKEIIGGQPGDEVLMELLHNPLVRRTMAIEQLTLDRHMDTMPNVSDFSRWEHVWGSVVFVRKMTENMNLSSKERMTLQLRTFVSDLWHTAYSHMGDWLFQGFGGDENQHDIDLGAGLELCGVTEILRRHGYDPKDIIFPSMQDWVENDGPDLCVDRADFYVRQILRMFGDNWDTSEALKVDSFSVVDGKLVMKDYKTAIALAKPALLLPSEHWGDPPHRLQLKLEEQHIKRIISAGYASISAIDGQDRGDYHPRSLLYTIDGDITRQTLMHGEFNTVLTGLMQEIAVSKRRIFYQARKGQLLNFINHPTSEFPDPLQPYEDVYGRIGYTALLPSNISMVAVESADDIPDFGKDPNRLDFFLPKLKPRYVDPLFKTKKGKVARLSNVDYRYRSLIRQQQAVLTRNYVAQVHVNEETKQIISQGIEENELAWKEALAKDPMPKEVLRRIINNSVAQAAVHSMIDLRWED